MDRATLEQRIVQYTAAALQLEGRIAEHRAEADRLEMEVAAYKGRIAEARELLAMFLQEEQIIDKGATKESS